MNETLGARAEWIDDDQAFGLLLGHDGIEEHGLGVGGGGPG